jgi:hypothetical protein
MARSCLFCNLPLSENKRAVEHVLPNGYGKKSTLIRRRKLEKTSVLFPNGEVRNSLEDLTEAERTLWAMWSVKTALVMGANSRMAHGFPREHYQTLFNGHMPACVAVYAAIRETSESFSWEVGRNWYFLAPEALQLDLTAQGKVHGYKVCFHLKNIFFLVACAPSPFLWLRRAVNAHVPIWTPMHTAKYVNNDPCFQIGTSGLKITDGRTLSQAFAHALHLWYQDTPSC